MTDDDTAVGLFQAVAIEVGLIVGAGLFSLRSNHSSKNMDGKRRGSLRSPR